MTKWLYSPEFQAKIAQEYLDGKGAYKTFAEKYLVGKRTKTSMKEQKEIVEYCIGHNRNYKQTVSVYDMEQRFNS